MVAIPELVLRVGSAVLVTVESKGAQQGILVNVRYLLLQLAGRRCCDGATRYHSALILKVSLGNGGSVLCRMPDHSSRLHVGSVFAE